jgi:nifR3 family TIM-barrel protein
MVYTEFIAADALVRNISRTMAKLEVADAERPVAMQIYGRDPATIAEAARICEEARPDVIDLNFGCPVKKIAGKGAGAGLLRTPELLLEIARTTVRAVKVPVTVKTRLGWDDDHKIIFELAEQLQDCGVSAITIHGRTRAQMYTGEADWTLIGQVKANPRMKIPVIGNGDITSPEKCREAFERYGVDAVMIGRASIGAPWIFREVKNFLSTGDRVGQLSFNQGLNILRRQILLTTDRLGERRGLLHCRRHLAVSPLFKGIPDFKPTKVAMLRVETLDELFGIMDSITQSAPSI